MGRHRKTEVMLKKVRDLHFPVSTNNKVWICAHCYYDWPCYTGRIVYTHDEIEHQLSHVANVRQFWEQDTDPNQEAYPTKSIPFGDGPPFFE